MASASSLVKNLAELSDACFDSKYTADFNSTFSYLESQVVGRTTEILAIRYALLLGQHVLLYGPHGTAKSFLAMKTFESIDDATVFSLQLRKEMGVDYVFGPMDIRRYRDKGIVVHNTRGMLPACEFAFLDEFFDANDNVLRGLLECLFERRFMGKNIPLRTVIATTNFYEEDARKDAVIDRFMFRVRVEPLVKRVDKRNMFSSYLGKKIKQKTFDMALLDDAESVLQDIALDKSWLTSLFDLVEAYSKQINKTYPVSDRRLCWCLDMLRASALLDGRDAVSEEDFKSLYFVLGVPKTELHDNSFFSAYDMVFPEKVPEEEGGGGIKEPMGWNDFHAMTAGACSEVIPLKEHMLTIIRQFDKVPQLLLDTGHCRVGDKSERTIKIVLDETNNSILSINDKFVLVDCYHKLNSSISDLQKLNKELDRVSELVLKTAVRFSLDFSNILPKLEAA